MLKRFKPRARFSNDDMHAALSGPVATQANSSLVRHCQLPQCMKTKTGAPRSDGTAANQS